MIKKAIVGVAAVGAVFALGRAVARMGGRMRERCEQMMARHAGRGDTVTGT